MKMIDLIKAQENRERREFETRSASSRRELGLSRARRMNTKRVPRRRKWMWQEMERTDGLAQLILAILSIAAIAASAFIMHWILN